MQKNKSVECERSSKSSTQLRVSQQQANVSKGVGRQCPSTVMENWWPAAEGPWITRNRGNACRRFCQIGDPFQYAPRRLRRGPIRGRGIGLLRLHESAPSRFSVGRRAKGGPLSMNRNVALFGRDSAMSSSCWTVMRPAARRAASSLKSYARTGLSEWFCSANDDYQFGNILS
jgi:hypothetical protein